MGRRQVLLVVAALATACGYRAGTFADPVIDFEGEQRTVGCIDVAVTRYPDRSTRGPAAMFTLGNRCDGPVLVDLSMPAVAYAGMEAVEVLEPRDPRGEIRRVYMEGRAVVREYIEYESPAVSDVNLLCFELSGLDAETSLTAPTWACLESAPEAPRLGAR